MIMDINKNEKPNIEIYQRIAAAPENINLADFSYVGDPGEIFDINSWYAESGVEAQVTIRNPGAVKVPDDMTTPIPPAADSYKIGFSVYYTADEMGSMILTSMQEAASEAGVELLVNDANYDQAVQNQAIAEWIMQKVDGIILGPCDFNGVQASLDLLEEADIPVVTLNSPLAGSTDAAVISNTVEQGTIAGELLVKAFQESGIPPEGTIIYQTLPFVHPNALTRARGFRDVFTDYPKIKIVELTGISPEEHFAAFEVAIDDFPDIIGAWGLYSSATIGMLDAMIANEREDILLSSVDTDKPILRDIFRRKIVGTAAYSAASPSRWCLSQLINLLNGALIPGIVFYPNQEVTPDNAAEAFEHYYPGETLEDYLKDSLQEQGDE